MSRARCCRTFSLQSLVTNMSSYTVTTRKGQYLIGLALHRDDVDSEVWVHRWLVGYTCIYAGRSVDLSSLH